MGSGGRRVRSGPSADPGALRRNRPSDRAGFVHLPSSGREGEPPPWPLSRPTKFELQRWEIEWRRPEAIMWERLGMEMQVALYVRTLREATKAGAAAARTNGLLRQIDNLGLSVAGRAANRWIIDDQGQTHAPRRAPTSTAKDRLAVIQGGVDERAS
jgi:hypothetical protein